MENLIFVLTKQPDKGDIDALKERIFQYNSSKGVPVYHQNPLAIFTYDRKQRIIAGLSGYTAWDWFNIEYLWIHEEYRRKKIGSKLLHEAEAEAMERGCYKAIVWTGSFHAPVFYEKLGYTSFAQILNHPTGHQYHSFVKNLIAV